MAGASSPPAACVPKRLRRSSQPSTQPGTTSESGPSPGIFFTLLLAKTSRVELVRTAAAGVQSVELLRLGVPVDDEQIAADAAAHRLDDAHHGVGGDGRVGRVAAALENVEPDFAPPAAGWWPRCHAWPRSPSGFDSDLRRPIVAHGPCQPRGQRVDALRVHDDLPNEQCDQQRSDANHGSSSPQGKIGPNVQRVTTPS